MKMNKRIWMVGILFTIHCSLFISSIAAQDKIVNPDISYAGTPRTCEIGGLAVKGVEGYEDYVLIGLSGLTVGQTISLRQALLEAWLVLKGIYHGRLHCWFKGLSLY